MARVPVLVGDTDGVIGVMLGVMGEGVIGVGVGVKVTLITPVKMELLSLVMISSWYS